jgi:ABC-type transporter MlaC component
MKQLLALTLISFAVPAYADRAEDAKKRCDAFIQALLKVRQADEGKTLAPADKAANEKVYTELDGFFDWGYLTGEPISPRADKFSKDERTQFEKKFKDVIRLVAYPDSGSFFRKAKWKISQGKDDGDDKATARIDASKDDLDTKVDIHFKLLDGALRIYDVSFDGDSLVQDYKNQMVRIIDKGGANGVKDLMAKVDKRKADLEAPPKEKAPKK